MMTTTIADIWLPLLNPTYGHSGIHVASRWFSSSTERFIDFQEHTYNTSGYTDYTEYLQYLMRYAVYNSGGTNTAEALRAVNSFDLPSSHQHLDKDHTYVAVFTDGQSNSYRDTVIAANELKNR